MLMSSVASASALGAFLGGTIGLLILGFDGQAIERELLRTIIVFLLLSTVLGATIGILIFWKRQLRGLNAMKRFFWSWVTKEEFHQLINKSLVDYATDTQNRSNELISLHRRGIEGTGGNIVQGTEEYRFNEERGRIERHFKLSQSTFYKRYDEIASFIDLFDGKGKLKERSWKVYAREPKAN